MNANGKHPNPGPEQIGERTDWSPRSSSYLNYLPVIFQNDEFMGRFLRIFETIWEPLEQRQDQIAMYFDPTTCPESFLPWLASWFDLPFNKNWPEPQRRMLLKEGFVIGRRSGTRPGLELILELCAGEKPEITQSQDDPFVYHIRISLPGDSSATEAFVNQIIQLHKPAHVGYTLEVN